jgi:hypothetical protein
MFLGHDELLDRDAHRTAVDYGGERLAELVDKGEPFYCHQSLRKIVKWRHPVGAEVDGHPGSYDPPIVVGPMEQFVPMKADGIPADICAGWWARYEQNLKAQIVSRER